MYNPTFRRYSVLFSFVCIASLLLASCVQQTVASTTLPTATAAPTINTTATIEVTSAVALTKISLGYYTGDEASYAALQKYAEYINTVSVDVYAVNADGEIIGSDPNNAVGFDREHNIATYACVSNYNDAEGIWDFDPDLAEAALVTYRDSLIPALVTLADEGGYDGINIDFESIAYSDDLDSVRQQFTSFIHDLAAVLHDKGLKLIISVPAKTGEYADDDWSYPFDLAALGEDADYLQLMTYDEHGPSWSDAGAISGADWVEQVIQYSVSQVDPAKLLIGFPAYSYDWISDGSNGDFRWVDFPTLLQKPGAESGWDEMTQSPWVSFTEDGLTHTVWYENDASIRAKAALVRQYDLGGWSMWALGKEDQSFWEAAISGG